MESYIDFEYTVYLNKEIDPVDPTPYFWCYDNFGGIFDREENQRWNFNGNVEYWFANRDDYFEFYLRFG